MKNPCTGLLVLFFLLVAGLGSVRAQSFEWAKLTRLANDTLRNSGSASSATDSNGNTYVHASYRDSVVVGRTTFRASGTMASIIVKYDSTGAVLWAKNLNGLIIVQLAADNSAGGVYFTGEQYPLNGAITWDGAPLPLNVSAPSPFYAKCSSSGALQWAQPLPINTGRGCSVVADDAGNAYLQSIAYAATTVGGVAVNANSVYILKINSSGTTQWVQTLTTAVGVGFWFGPSKLGAKPGGGCLLSGSIPGGATLLLGSGTPLLTSASINDVFLINFDSSGTPLWTNVLGAWSQSATTQAISSDAAGNCYITGGASNGIQLGGISLPPGCFLAKYNASGTLLWARGEQQGTAASFNAGYLLSANNKGVSVAVAVQNPTTNPAVLGSLILRTYFNIVHYTPQGDEQWAASDSRINYSATTPIADFYSISGLGTDTRGNVYTTGTSQNRFGTGGGLPTLQLGAHTTVGRGVVTCRINAYANTLRGQVYLDQNGNGQQDATEPLFPRPLTGVLTQGSATSYSAVGADGVLQAYATPGPYSLTIAQVYSAYTLTQPIIGAYAGTFSGSNQSVTGQNFGIAPIANVADVSATITPYGAVRAGLIARYRITVENLGTTTVSGSVSATLDSHLSYVSSTPGGNRNGQIVSWSYAGLAPFGRQEYDILASLPTNVALGTAIISSIAAPLANDADVTNNAVTLTQTVVGPYDPNSMEVNYSRLTPAQVAAKQPLDYTIHFQNLGSAPAQNVILSDTLDFQKLNPATLMLVAQSHNCIWSLTSTGPNTGLLTVRFLGINLPEQNADVIRSMGFVRFRVQPRPTLAVGEVIPNQASIVFDYNSGIRTNTAITTVFLATAALARHENPAWETYPNPATDYLTISADLPAAGPVRLELFDALGRPIRQQTLAAPAGPLRQTLDLSTLARGLYVLRLTPPTGPAISRQVVHE